jgi:hypothetical protein
MPPTRRDLSIAVDVGDSAEDLGGWRLTDAEANQLRGRVYATLHQGSAHQWAAGGDEKLPPDMESTRRR